MNEPIRILVVDDSEDDRLLYRRTLSKGAEEQYVVTEADNGDEIIQVLQDNPPDCILLDYSLPGRNGLEVLKRLRGRHPFIPVIMMTGQGNEAVAVSAIKEGAYNYITKSAITPESLQRLVRLAIENSALHRRIHEQRTSLEIFTRALAHDLKEPVRTIRSFLDLIVLREPLSERGKGYFHHIQHAADRMSMLIDTIYFYTRLDGADQRARHETCDMGSILKDTTDNLGELIRERSATITSDPLPQVDANRMQVMQVLQNLLVNAIRHCEQSPVIHLCAEEGIDQWIFRVSDNGPGISSEYGEKIFEPFKRMSHAKEQGLGLGLAICKRIVESHGGKIWYESRLNAGATFLFTLPKAISAPDTKRAAPAKARMTPTEDNTLGTIMLVEDNAADVELARIMLLEEAGLKCNLLVARDGQEALDRLCEMRQNEWPVDLVLLDINMPGMDGFEMLKRMHAEDALRDIPVVMCTTSTYDKDMERAKAMGAGYMTKPAEIEKLKPLLEETATIHLQKQGSGYALLRAA